MRYFFLLFCPGAALLSGQGSPDVVISQAYGGGGNTGAPLRQDFIELFNRGRMPVNLGGWSVQYASATGDSWQVTPLSGSIQPGRYFLIQQAEGANTTLPTLPAPDITGTIAMSATAAKVALSRSTAPLAGTRPVGTVDLLGYGAANAFEGNAPASALTNSTAAARRSSGCTDTDDNASDFQTAEPRPRSSTTTSVDCSLAPEPPVSLRISDVQGSGSLSPYNGRNVTVRGVITGKARDGFWIQSVPGQEDSNPETSEGLWIYFAMAPPGTTERGYVLQVTGTVIEYRPAADPGSDPLTEIIDPRYEVLSTGQTLPNGVVLDSGANWERYENMLVQAGVATAVSPTVGNVFYAVLAGQPRPYRGPSPADQPERLRVDMSAQSAAVLNTTSPSMVSGISGVLDYAFRTWTVAQSPTSTLTSGDLRRAQTVPVRETEEFVAVSMNLQRMNSASGVKFAKAAQVIRDYLRSPEIIAVQEVDNIDVLRTLAREAGDYDAFLLEGNDIGGIDVGFLTRRDRVQVESVVQEGRDLSYAGGPLWERPPLVAKLSVAAVPVTAIAVHPRSLINAEDPVVAGRRRAQAEFLRDLAATRLRAGETVLMLGDFNTMPFDDNMSIIRSAGLTNLTDTLPPPESYSYLFEGATQTLDHILISDALRTRLTRTTFARVNADFPESFAASAETPERISDHDMPIAYFSLNPGSLQVVSAGITNAATFLSGPVAPMEIVTIFGRGFNAESTVFFDNVAGQMVYASISQVSVIAPAGVEGRSATGIQVETNAVRTSPIVLPVVTSSPGIFVTDRTGGRNQGAVLNQNNSVNGPANPALRGSVVQIFATGQGSARNVQPASVRIGGHPAVVTYSGQAPGLVPGAWQINATVPNDLPAGNAELILSAGGRISPFGVVIAVQ